MNVKRNESEGDKDLNKGELYLPCLVGIGVEDRMAVLVVAILLVAILRDVGVVESFGRFDDFVEPGCDLGRGHTTSEDIS